MAVLLSFSSAGFKWFWKNIQECADVEMVMEPGFAVFSEWFSWVRKPAATLVIVTSLNLHILLQISSMLEAKQPSNSATSNPRGMRPSVIAPTEPPWPKRLTQPSINISRPRQRRSGS